VRDESAYFAHYNGPLHIGLGISEAVDELRILWPSGLARVWHAVRADRVFVVHRSRVLLPLVLRD
jgi:hypothetical protein